MKVLFGFQAEQNNYKDIAAEKLGVIYPGKPTINTSTGMDSNNQKVALECSRWTQQMGYRRILRQIEL